MEKILYSKYSNQRVLDYCIRTDIIERGTKKVVRKVPMSQRAEQHVKRIFDLYERLEEKFAGTKLSANYGEKHGGYLEFEYISGKSYEQLLDEQLEKDDEDNFYRILNEFVVEIHKVYKEKIFVSSEAFRNVFGDVELPKDLMAAEYIDIDLIFSNVIMQNDRWWVIDYEWTFDFLIPVNYLLWRAVHEYVNFAGSRVRVSMEGLLNKIGISHNEALEYEKMERHFQFEFCYKNAHALYALQNDFGKPIIAARDILDMAFRQEKLSGLQVYFDSGSEFSEEQSIFYDVKCGGANDYRVYISVGKDWKRVRIDPAQKACIVKIISIQALTSLGRRELRYETNGIGLQKDVFLFNTSDPQIYILDGISDVSEIEFIYKLQDLPDDTGTEEIDLMKQLLRINRELSELNKEIEERKKDIEEKKKEIEERKRENIQLQNQIEDKRVEIEEKDIQICELQSWSEKLNRDLSQTKNVISLMENSKSWRITKPLRKVTELISSNKNNEE